MGHPWFHGSRRVGSDMRWVAEVGQGTAHKASQDIERSIVDPGPLAI
jgi:hypothetical protein